MIQNWNVEVTTENGNVFFVEYRSLMDSEHNDGFSAGTIIKSVQLQGYYLSLGQLRECLVWDELKEAVKGAAIDKWDAYWVIYNERKQNAVLDRQLAPYKKQGIPNESEELSQGNGYGALAE